VSCKPADDAIVPLREGSLLQARPRLVIHLTSGVAHLQVPLNDTLRDHIASGLVVYEYFTRPYDGVSGTLPCLLVTASATIATPQCSKPLTSGVNPDINISIITNGAHKAAWCRRRSLAVAYLSQAA